MTQTVRAARGMVVSSHHLAAQSGLRVLRAGGNAIEAMIAAAATISVVYPHMNGIGGDGFWLIAAPGDDAPTAILGVGRAGRAVPGRRVAIVGGGGIGFDVALYLVERASKTHLEPASFAAHWGIDLANAGPGGLAKNGHAIESPHTITMLKRSPGSFGRTLGKTTGWVHRLSLQRAGVRFLDGVVYRAIDERGLHILRGEKEECIEADTIVVCAGQESLRALDEDALRAVGIACTYIGGAKLAAELDAKRAIEDGVRVGCAL